MSIYVTGDTHGGIDKIKLETKRFPESKNLTRDDYVIILGDFGIWNNKKAQYFIDWLDKEKKFTTLFIEGNHEDYNLLKSYPTINKFGSEVRQIRKNIFHLKRGEIYDIDNYKIFTFGGASSIDKISACRQEGIDWFPEEQSSYIEELNALDKLNKNSNKVDVILTHTCSSSTLEELSKLYGFYLEKFDNQNIFFEELKNIIDYKLWCFGHMHKDLIINEKEVAIYNKVYKIEDLLEL